MNTDVKINGTDLCIGIESIIQAMDLKQKREVLAWLATDFEVVNSVVDHIVGDDELGWSMGDANMMQEILSRVESSIISSPRYNWRVWSDLNQKIKDIRSTEHLYWVLYHRIDPEVSRMVMDELRRLGVEPNYTTKQGDDDVSQIKKLIGDTFISMKEESK